MPSQTRTRPGKAPSLRRPWWARADRPWWGVGAAAVLVAAVTIAWTVGAGGEDRPVAGAPVEQFSHVHGLEIPAWQPQTVFMATHQGLIQIADHGWSYVSAQRHDLMGFAAHPTEPDLFYSSGHPAEGSDLANPVGFLVSTDGGATWQVRALAGEVDFHAMTIGAGGLIYGWNGHGEPGLYRSTDDGHTWTVVEAPALFAAGGVFALAAHPEDPDRLWAATDGGLIHSSDAGASWRPATTGMPVTAVTIDPTDPDRMLAYAPSPGDGLLESLDAGQSWTPTGWALEAGDDAAGHLAIHPDDPRASYAATYRMDLLRSGDGGRTWQPLARAGTPDQ